ncbi:MAG: hypothetical protein ACFFEV_10145 [Candidatus Thorarchaeota archaeon]
MREATSSHNLRGLSLICDLHFLFGLGLIVAGVFFLFGGNLVGLIFAGIGVLLTAIGHYLDELEPWAWWGALLGNLGLGGSVFYIISGTPLEIAISVVFYLLQALWGIAILVYLLRPSVRELFFNR